MSWGARKSITEQIELSNRYTMGCAPEVLTGFNIPRDNTELGKGQTGVSNELCRVVTRNMTHYNKRCTQPAEMFNRTKMDHFRTGPN